MEALYHSDPYLKDSEGAVLASFEEDDGRYYVSLENGIFYPQGGGQKGDRGVLVANGQELVVINTVKDPMSSNGRPLCILQSAANLKQGDPVRMRLDWAHRFDQMRLHSIVHLHHCMMEEIAGHALSNPTTSDLNDDRTGYNRYDLEEITQELAEQASVRMKEKISIGSAIKTIDDPLNVGYRYWESLGFSIPCGGTHLRDISEIGIFDTTFSRKKGKPKISFSLLD